MLDAQSEKLSSFEVAPATGHLTLRGSITAPSPTVFTADPKGRFLFVGGGGGAGAAYVAPYVATYALEKGVPVQRGDAAPDELLERVRFTASGRSIRSSS